MLSSFKAKIFVSAISVLAAFIIISVSAANTNPASVFQDDNICPTAQLASTSLDAFKQKTFFAVTTMAESGELIRHVYNRDREALLRYLRQGKETAGVNGFIVFTADGFVLARSHSPDSFGDFVAHIPIVALALQGQTVTVLTTTPTAMSVISSTSGIFYDGNLIGGIVANFYVD